MPRIFNIGKHPLKSLLINISAEPGLKPSAQKAVKQPGWIILSAAALILLATLACQILTPPSIGFSPNVMPTAKVGTYYFVIIKIENNRTPAGEFSITQGSLPKGLGIQRLEGQDAVLISGTPEYAGAFHFVLSVWCFGTNNSGQTGVKDYILPVSPLE